MVLSKIQYNSALIEPKIRASLTNISAKHLQDKFLGTNGLNFLHLLERKFKCTTQGKVTQKARERKENASALRYM
jgi:hypothetical protein